VYLCLKEEKRVETLAHTRNSPYIRTFAKKKKDDQTVFWIT
jgi:hypothetical protein